MVADLQILILLPCFLTLSAQSIKIYPITKPVDHTECPFWDERNNVLYFVNLHQGEIYRYDYYEKSLNYIKLNGEVAPVIPSQKDPNLLIAGLNRSIVAVEWNGLNKPRILTNISNQFPTSRVNDGKADSRGRLWIGTIGHNSGDDLALNEGVLYTISCKNINSPKVAISPVNISNGLAWNAADDKFFYVDTSSAQIAEYKFNAKNGEISNRRTIFDMRNFTDKITNGPDGITIDEDDNLWIAFFGGGSVLKVNSSNGELLQVVSLPVRDVTSVMWGGPKLDILYVTTSRLKLSDKLKMQQPKAGSAFAVEGLGTRGKPMNKVDLLASIDDMSCGSNLF